MTARPTAFEGIRRQLCPRCRQGPLFRLPVWRGPISMHQRCPVCGLKFERESGYYVGAMYMSYALMLPPALVICLVVWRVSRWPFDVSVIATFLILLPLAPFVMRLARVLWIYFNRRVDPD